MSGPGFRVPPGRAGRLWLDRRLGAARRGADLLDRKLHILQAELTVRQSAAAAASADWDRCRVDADLWLLRASLLGGQRAMRLSTDGALAEVTVTYTDTMGAHHPDGASCVIPASGGWDSPVIAAVRQAHRAALTAAVRQAAAAEALRVIQTETAATRYRLRAIRKRWIPRLEQAMADITLAIEEQELGDAARLRLASVPGR